jgi:serine-type D-Ala-D-Ala carboxypeptidase/endopeptidase (penicillin-binding protein 4)
MADNRIDFIEVSRMKRSLLFLCALVTLLSSVAHGDLASDVRRILADPFLAHTRHGVKLMRLADGQAVTLFESNADLPLVPASNLKLVTTSAAMAKLGPDFKFRTLLLAHGDDLVLVGDGDPSFGDAELLKKSGWDVRTIFQTWAAALARRKIGPFSHLWVDDSVFDEQFLNPHWPADQAQKHYMAEVAGMNLNANLADVYVKPSGSGELVHFVTDPRTRYFTIHNTCMSGADNRIWLSRQTQTNDLSLGGEAAEANDVPVSVTVHDPPLYAATVLAESLEDAGISIGSVGRDRTARERYLRGEAGWTLLAVNQTPLTAVMANANKNSVNLYAECCAKRLGFAVYGEGAWPNGVAAVGQFLKQIGVPDDQYRLDDGCGLSKENAISANLMTTVLEHDFYSPSAKAFMDTMAIAGVDGTMEDRFRGTDLRGRVLAKSGFVNGVSCLSGYLHGRDGDWYGFSILFNEVPAGGTSQAKTIEERIVRAVDKNV